MKRIKTKAYGWHFMNERLSHGDGRVPKVGEWISVKGKIKPCENGLHASPRPSDAHLYFRGWDRPVWLCRVALGGTIVNETKYPQKMIARHRRIIRRVRWPVEEWRRVCQKNLSHDWDELANEYARGLFAAQAKRKP